jgi:molecular chaperone DnaJ
MPVDGFSWLASAWIEIPTLTGLQQMRLQRGRNLYRLRGQGLPLERRGTDRGDFLVTVSPSFPDSLSAAQRALLEQLAKSPARDDTTAPMQAWLRKVKAWERSRPAAPEPP